MVLADRIRQAISASGALDDDELAARLHVVRQQVNQTARRMEQRGELVRYTGPRGKIVNALVREGSATVPHARTASRSVAATRPRVTDPDSTTAADLLLVTCVKEKAPTPRAAKDLYTSALFRKERAYAERSGLPWYILSAEHGLVAPEEWMAPYERYLPDTPLAYREAWGRWVVARLALLEGDVRGRRIEIHASEEYVGWLRPHLISSGAVVHEPLKGLVQGQRLAWYGARADVRLEREAEALPSVDELVTVLRDFVTSVTPAELLAAGAEGLRVPGLYSWWVDEAGANDLTVGLGHRIDAGLVYAGLAGATRWPSGQRSKNTLWTRITGMHLGGNHEMSTLRRTFGSMLAEAQGWSSIDESALTLWMGEHLRVVLVPYADADGLGQMEKAVLSQLDPPLNLMGMATTELRRALSRLRSTYSSS
jgi:hypothetical protein